METIVGHFKTYKNRFVTIIRTNKRDYFEKIF